MKYKQTMDDLEILQMSWKQTTVWLYNTDQTVLLSKYMYKK